MGTTREPTKTAVPREPGTKPRTLANTEGTKQGTTGNQHQRAMVGFPPSRGNQPDRPETSTTTNHDFPRGDPANYAKTSADPVGALLWMLDQARPSWHDEASCRGSGLDFTSPARPNVAACLQICGRCPPEVRNACLDWALDIEDNAAILGGTDPAARRVILKQRQKAQVKP